MIRKSCDNKKVLSAISSLEHNDDFKQVREWLKEELSSMREECDTEQGIHLSWNQGGCQALSAVINVIDTARNTIKAIDLNAPMVAKGSWV